MIALRDYQKDVLDSTWEARKRGVSRLLWSMATGAGKTVTFAALARDLNMRTLILAHRDELLKQAADKVRIIWPDVDIGFVKAKQNDYEAQVVIASVQTLANPKRLEKIASQAFGLLIIDECHHAVSPTYQRVIERLGFMESAGDRLLVGVTATANRADGTPLGNIFEEITCNVGMLSLMREGYLADIRAFRVQTDVDLSSVHSRGGDFIDWELAKVINTPARNRLVVDKYLEHAPGRKAIAFCVAVQHSHDLADAFMEQGITAKALSGATPPDEREEALAAFSRGEIQVLTNCNLLTEGFDEPTVGCVLMTRPTKSQALYIQCIGRGTRKAPGKEDCVVVDFTENRNDVCMLPSLFGIANEKMEFGEKTVVEILEEEEADAKRQASMEQRIKRVKVEEFDLVGKSRFAWFETNSEWRLTIKPKTYAVLRPQDGRYIVQLTSPEGISLLHDTALPLGFAMGVAEDYVRETGDRFAQRDARWRSDAATQKQIDLLTKFGVDVPDGLSKGEASQMIDQAFAMKQTPRRKVM